MSEPITLGRCLVGGWEGFKKNAGPAIGTWVVFWVLSAIGGTIPVLNIAFQLILSPVISAGLAIFSLKAARGEEGNVEDLFRGFDKFGAFLGAYWIFVLIVIACFIPAGIGIAIDLAIGGGSFPDVPIVTIVLSAAGTIVLVIALIRFSMVNYLIIDDVSVSDAFKESNRITEGYRAIIFLLAVASVFINLLGFILLVFGLLVTLPLTSIAFAVLYARIRERAISSSAVAGEDLR